MVQVVSETLTVRGAAGEASSSPCVQYCEQTVVIKQTMNVFLRLFLAFHPFISLSLPQFFFTHIHLVVALTLCLLFIHVVRFNAQVRPCHVPKQGFSFSWSTFYACYIFPLPPRLSFSGCFFTLMMSYSSSDGHSVSSLLSLCPVLLPGLADGDPRVCPAGCGADAALKQGKASWEIFDRYKVFCLVLNLSIVGLDFSKQWLIYGESLTILEIKLWKPKMNWIYLQVAYCLCSHSLIELIPLCLTAPLLSETV